MELPAGLLPEDRNIEFFAKPNQFGKCYWLSCGNNHERFADLPQYRLDQLTEECFMDRRAIKGMELMGISYENMVEQYNFCNRGKLDSTPDITECGKLNKEYFDCGRHDKCVGDGKVCGRFGLTFRERQCLKLHGLGKTYDQIKSEMGFRSTTAVNSLTSRLKSKCNASNKTELSIYAHQIGIV